MADIEILVDSSQVKTAKQDLQDLGNSFNSAAKSASVYMQAFARAAAQSARDANYIRDVARANQEVINKNLKVSNSYSSAEASAAAFTEELRKQEAQAQKTARANQDAINKRLGVSGPSATSSGAGYGAIEAEILRLETMYNKVAVAARVYEQAEKSLNSAVLMGVLTIDQKEAKLAELSLAYQKVGNDADKAQAFINRFGENAQVSGRGLNRFGMYAQQVGYQVGDFFVQVQSGTNVLVAFGQQATQLAGLIPGVWGAAIGIGISLATAIGAAFMRMGEAAEESAKGLDTQKQAFDALTQSIKQLRLERQMAGTGLDETQQNATNELNKLQAQYNVLLQEQAELNEEAQKSASDTETKYQIANAAAIAATKAAIAEVERKLRILAEEKRLAEEAINYEKQLEIAAKRRANERRNEYREAKALQDVQKALNDALAAGNQEQFNKVMNEALEAGVRFSQTDLSSVVALAAKQGWSLVGALRAAWDAAGGGVVNADPSMGPSFERGGKLRGSSRQATYQPTFSEIYNREIDKAGGGGGVETDPLEELRQQIKLETELLGVSEAQARVLQALGKDRSKYSQAEIDAITAEIEAYNQKQEAIERTKQIMDTVKSSMEDAFMSMVDGTKSAKDAFRSMAAEIIKELYRVLVVQQLVNSISGAIGGIFGGSSAPASSPRPMPRPVGAAVGGSIMTGGTYLVGENGPELVIPRHSGTVVNANQTANAMGGNGSVTVNNNISVTGSDAAMVRTEIAKMIPQITNATKAAVIDAKQRGGQMAAAFR